MKRTTVILLLGLLYILLPTFVFADNSGVLWKSRDGHLIFGSEATATQNLPLNTVGSIAEAGQLCSGALVYAVTASRSGCLPLTATSFSDSDGKTHFACYIEGTPNFISLNDASCAKGNSGSTTQPSIDSITPTSVSMDKTTPGFDLTIKGSGFGDDRGAGGVSISGMSSNNSGTFLSSAIQSWSDEEIKVYVRPRSTLPNGETKWQVSVIPNEPKLVLSPNLLIVTSDQEPHTFSVNQPTTDQPKITPIIFIADSPLSSNANLNLFTTEDLKKVQVKLSVTGQSTAQCSYTGENQNTYNITVKPSSGGQGASQSVALCQDTTFTLLNDPNGNYSIGVIYHGNEYSWTFKIKNASTSEPAAGNQTSNTIPASQIAPLITLINGKCIQTSDPKQCSDSVKAKCFGENNIDTSNFDTNGGSATFDLSKYTTSSLAVDAVNQCILGFKYSQFPPTTSSGSIYLEYSKDSGGGTYVKDPITQGGSVFDFNLAAGPGIYTINIVLRNSVGNTKTIKTFKVNYQPPSSGASSNIQVLSCTGNCSICPSGQVEGTVKYGDGTTQGACVALTSCPSGQNTCSGSSSGGGAAGTGSGSGAGTGSGASGGGSGSTQVLSCTGRCAVCPSGQVEGTVKYGNGTTQGACVGLSSCPSGQQTCTDSPATNAPSCEYSEACGNGGTRIIHNGRYISGQCRYVSGTSTYGDCVVPKVCSPGAYDSHCTGRCVNGCGELEVRQCNSDGSAWGSSHGECSSGCQSYCGASGGGPSNGTACTYPESISTSICPSGVHVCHGLYDNGTCKYNGGVDPQCQCS